MTHVLASSAEEWLGGIVLIIVLLLIFGGNQIDGLIEALKIRWSRRAPRKLLPDKYCMGCGSPRTPQAKHCPKCGKQL